MEADLHGSGIDVRGPCALPYGAVAQAEDVGKGETHGWSPSRDGCHGAPVRLVAHVSSHPEVNEVQNNTV